MIIFVLIFIPIGAFQSFQYMPSFKAPTELWQFLKRLIIFLSTAIFMSRSCEKSKNQFLSFTFLTTLLLLLVGLLQILGSDFLVDIYARTERQGELASQDNAQRIFGVAGHSIAWGGLLIFINFSLFCIIHELSKRFKFFRRWLYIIFIISTAFVAINVIGSGSRSSMITLAFCYLLLYLLTFTKLGLTNVFILPTLCITVGGVGYVMYSFFSDRLDFLIYRFSHLSESGVGGRSEQIIIGLNLLKEPYEIMLGVSSAYQRFVGVPYSIESEPFNIFTNYGLIGFILVYSTPLLFIMFFYKHYRRDDYFLFVWLTCAIIGSLVFSLGYFYFAEVVVGSYSWIILGIFSGLALRNKKRSFSIGS
ncbi:hypothetical protein BCU83_17860 [Vibrio breoganii]|nr:hypothetical protein BCU83_17860 [Vibrio breoganii]